MRVTYLTIEDISTGLFQTQVLDIISEICNNRYDIEYEILVVNRPWFILRHMKKINEIRSNNIPRISIKYIPLLPPLRHALSSKLYSSFVTIWLSIIYFLFVRRDSRILHCRSYWPTQAALIATNVPVLFDMRSLWILENISMDLLEPKSKCSEYWYKMELNCLKGAKISACVSSGMIDYCEKKTNRKTLRLIPISVKICSFKFSESFREQMRNSLGFVGKTVLVYSGSFGQANINFFALRKFFSFLLASDSNVRILFLTGEKEEKIIRMLEDVDNFREKYALIRPSFNQMGDWLSVGDIGVHALPKQLDFATRLGTKVVEYWANGLPVIVNEYVGAAAQLINENELGFVLNEEIYIQGPSNEFVNKLRFNERGHQSSFANRTFSTNVLSDLYIQAYLDCLS